MQHSVSSGFAGVAGRPYGTHVCIDLRKLAILWVWGFREIGALFDGAASGQGRIG